MDGTRLASALNLVGGEALYGRYWGRVADVPFLHFELCYYQAIELAIELGLPRVEAGAQGEHKLARGYMPVQTYSAHWIEHEGLRNAVKHYLRQETPAVVEEAEILADHTPFKKASDCRRRAGALEHGNKAERRSRTARRPRAALPAPSQRGEKRIERCRSPRWRPSPRAERHGMAQFSERTTT